jgi:hypothetical protein
MLLSGGSFNYRREGNVNASRQSCVCFGRESDCDKCLLHFWKEEKIERERERAGMFCCTCEVYAVVTLGSGSDGSYQNLLRRKAELISLKGPSYFLRAQSEFFSGAFVPFIYREGEIIDFQ